MHTQDDIADRCA